MRACVYAWGSVFWFVTGVYVCESDCSYLAAIPTMLLSYCSFGVACDRGVHVDDA
jgi:hypothetical protein